MENALSDGLLGKEGHDPLNGYSSNVEWTGMSEYTLEKIPKKGFQKASWCGLKGSWALGTSLSPSSIQLLLPLQATTEISGQCH